MMPSTMMPSKPIFFVRALGRLSTHPVVGLCEDLFNNLSRFDIFREKTQPNILQIKASTEHEHDVLFRSCVEKVARKDSIIACSYRLRLNVRMMFTGATTNSSR